MMEHLWTELQMKWLRAVNLYLHLRVAYLEWRKECLEADRARRREQ